LTNRRVFTTALTALAAAATLAASSLAATAPRTRTPTKHVVAARQNALLERKVLTTTQGLTLYSLKIERNGKFACVSTCLAEWHPLLIGAGTKPTGPVKLGTVKRSDDGKTQVTYQGMPLYTFGGDSAAGQANGNGIVDVGRWHVAAPPIAG
jgi:predicted lipoprotein with Yx(FWY)xxD motif